MNDDVDVTMTDSGGSSGVDPLFQSIYGGGTTTEVAPRRVGFPTLPPFTHYILKPLKATRRRTEKNVGARVQVEVLEGPEGTVGHKFTDSGEVAYGFIVSPTDKDGNTLSTEAYKKKCNSRQGLLNRVRQALGLAVAWPASFADFDVESYCAQFERGGAFIAEVTVEQGSDGVKRNRIQWSSVAALDEKITEGKFVGKTAQDEAREMIRLLNARKPAGGAAGSAGKSSGSLGPADLR